MNFRRLPKGCIVSILVLGAGGVLGGASRARGQRIQPLAPQPSSSKENSQTLPDASPASSQRGTPPAGSLTSSDVNSSLPPADTTVSQPASDYVIGPEDVLNISVFNLPDLTQTVRVANDGTIPVLLLGEVRAEGLTAEELQKKLERLYGRTYLQNPLVTVYISQFNAQPVSVIGAVARPGNYQLTGKRTLIEMLSLAGGLGSSTSWAPAGRYVYVTRKGGFGDLPMAEGMKLEAPDELRIDLHRLFYSHDSALNIPIKSRDIISVSRAEVVYVTGRGVEKPGGFVLGDRNNITVLQAIAMAQGLATNASAKYARIIHTEPNGAHTEVPVNVDKIIRGKAPDPVLEANDILWVPNSAEKAAVKKGVEEAIQTISGYLIFHP